MIYHHDSLSELNLLQDKMTTFNLKYYMPYRNVHFYSAAHYLKHTFVPKSVGLLEPK